MPDLNVWIDPTPCFPLFVYDKAPSAADGTTPDLFDAQGSGEPSTPPGRHHNVTDHALRLCRALDPAVGKDDIFFYVYGILHSPDYRTAFAADLKKSLPRIPQVASANDFWAFSNAGRDLAHLHTEYESVEPWPDLTYTHADAFDPTHPLSVRVR